MANDREKLNRVEDLKRKLFSKGYRMKIEHRDNFTRAEMKNVVDSWKKKEGEEASSQDKFFMKTSMFKKFFIFSLVFFILAAGFSAYMYFAGKNTVSSENIEITILGNPYTAGGEELPLQVEIINKNSSSLELADLIIEYPKSSANSLAQETERFRASLGTIPAGGVRNESAKIVLYGEKGSVIPIKILLEYRVEGSNAIFVKDKLYEVAINSTPINLSLQAPEEVSPNQNITLNVKATLNAKQPAAKILVKVDYPVGFQFESAKPAPSFGNNIWNLGDLSPGTER